MESLPLRRGFTLIELLVVLAIIIMVSGIVFSGQGSFNKSLILANAAYDVALTVRSAETYGLGSRAAGSVTNVGYGIHFDMNTPTSFTLFADTYPGTPSTNLCHGLPTGGDANSPDAQPGDCAYEASYDTPVATYQLGNGISINELCAYTASGGSLCSPSFSTLDIVFARPNPQAFISVNGAYSAASSVTGACLGLTSPQGGSRFISVSSSGEITGNAASCP